MAARKVPEGRALVTLKIRRSVATSEVVADMPEGRALAIYRIANGRGYEAVKSVLIRAAIEKAREHLARGERNFAGLLDDIEAAL